MNNCRGITKDLKNCTRLAKYDGFCWQHKNMINKNDDNKNDNKNDNNNSSDRVLLSIIIHNPSDFQSKVRCQYKDVIDERGVFTFFTIKDNKFILESQSILVSPDMSASKIASIDFDIFIEKNTLNNNKIIFSFPEFECTLYYLRDQSKIALKITKDDKNGNNVDGIDYSLKFYDENSKLDSTIRCNILNL